MSFSKDVKKWAKKTNETMEDITIGTIMQLNELIIDRTPVIYGQARGGWIASLDSPSRGKGTLDKIGHVTLSKANAVAKKAAGEIYYLMNNVGQIRILEYGKYPNPPVLGSWDKETQQFEKLSFGGYSRQAPQGMVRVSVKSFKHAVKKMVRKYGD